MAIVLVATSGAVVDFVRINSARSTAQIAIDAASLALQPEIYSKTEPQIQALAQALLIERLGDSSITATIGAIDTNLADGTLLLRADLVVPMTFVALMGIETMTTRLVSQATRKRLFVEVAFVLDNSYSMTFSSRMTHLKSATICATKILFYGSCTPPNGATQITNVKAGVIPFNTFVNVGSSNASASWMDTTGISSISNDNFDDDDDDSTPFTSPVNRFALYNQISNVSWEGCVEARPYPYSVDDTVPSSGTPDTLFVPVFAPDEPDPSGYSYGEDYLDDSPAACNTLIGSCACTTTYVPGHWGMGCKWNGGWGYCSGSNTTTCNLTETGGTVVPGACSCSGGASSCSAYASTPGLSHRELQERLCKYTGYATGTSGSGGPNSDCLGTSILALSDNPNTIISRINAMTPTGYTNIHQGAIWGFHTLSPTLPYSEGRDYDTAVSKVMILMTDGENTFVSDNNMNGSDFSQAYGHMYNAPTNSTSGRLGKSVANGGAMPAMMNTLTMEACANAKSAGIQVYTIGLNPPNQTTRDMLTTCASSVAQAYFPSQPSELNAVFSAIAEQLSKLRLAK